MRRFPWIATVLLLTPACERTDPSTPRDRPAAVAAARSAPAPTPAPTPTSTEAVPTPPEAVSTSAVPSPSPSPSPSEFVSTPPEAVSTPPAIAPARPRPRVRTAPAPRVEAPPAPALSTGAPAVGIAPRAGDAELVEIRGPMLRGGPRWNQDQRPRVLQKVAPPAVAPRVIEPTVDEAP